MSKMKDLLEEPFDENTLEYCTTCEMDTPHKHGSYFDSEYGRINTWTCTICGTEDADK